VSRWLQAGRLDTIMPFSFFLVFPALPRFTKKDVDACDIGEEAAILCDVIRAVYFLSRSIRKERTLWLSFAANRALVRMAGDTLRYLGPDERSTLMLIDKAADVLKANPASWVESTPGTACRAGIDPGSALALIASERPGLMLVAPTFTGGGPAGQPAITFPSDLPVLAASRGIVLAMALDGRDIASWAGASPASSRPEQLINVEVKCVVSSPTLASKILAFNVIEDNTKGY
jgi:hypothetical protein